MKETMQVRCADCAKFSTMKNVKPRRRYCAYTGAKISMAQSKKLIDCDFFEDLAYFNPESAGWRAYSIIL